MTSIRKAAQNTRRMTRDSLAATKQAVAGGAMMQAAGEVIAARLEMMSDPRRVDLAEMALMSTEKLDAVAASAVSLSRNATRMGGKLVETALSESQHASRAAIAVASAATPAAMVAAQMAWASGWWTRATSQLLNLNGELLKVQAQAIRPIHDKAVANARRLRRD